MTRFARHDLAASLVVFLVAVPLSLGIAVASDAPLMSGLIAAAAGGIVAGTLSGTPLQVSGPAAGLTVIVTGLVDQFGWRATGAITVGAGLIQLALGASRVARTVLAISPTVVHGMLAGIGATIALGQLHVLLGGGGGVAGGGAGANLVEVVLGLGVIVLLGLWPRLPAAVRHAPGHLVAVVALTLLAETVAPDASRIDLPGSLRDAVALPEWPRGSWFAVGLATLTLAVVASVESLVSAVAVDELRPGTRPNLDRELVGQGTANVVSGLLGGLPVTGVIVRSSTNVLAGATSRASAILHGVWVVLFGVALAGLLERIPMAVLAGLLIAVGAQLVKPDHVRTHV